MKYGKLLAGVSLLLLTTCASRPEPADLIIVGGRIYTVNDQQPVVEGVAVRDGKIVFAGTEEQARSFEGSSTKVVDLQGKIMTPGFIEGHGHIMGVGYNELELDLMAVKSYDELVLEVQKAVEKARPGEWIVGLV